MALAPKLPFSLHVKMPIEINTFINSFVQMILLCIAHFSLCDNCNWGELISFDYIKAQSVTHICIIMGLTDEWALCLRPASAPPLSLFLD